jgi:protein-disulfide isomerase
MSIVRTRVSLCFVLALLSAPLMGDDTVSCKQLDEVLTELREMRKLIEGGPSARAMPQPVSAVIDVEDAPHIGSKDAPLTIVEFTDYQCTFCQQFHNVTFPVLKRIYIDSGKVRFYVMDLPLVDKHNNALMAAQAARCAGEQGRFWEMHDRMQANPDSLDKDHLAGYVSDLGMDPDAFRRCAESPSIRDAIIKGADAARSKGANATPSFVIGKSTPTGVDGDIVVGAVPLGAFEQKFRNLMK